MKCEMCHEHDAETAIEVVRDGEEDELYVCNECAKKERVKRQKKSARTRKVTGLPPGVEMSITEIAPGEGCEDGDGPPPIVGAIFNAFHDMVSEIEKAKKDTEEKKDPKYHTLPCERADARYRIGRRLHLEGLYLIGELEPCQRAMRALGMRLVGVCADGVKDAGHVFAVEYTGSAEAAKRAAEDLLAQERNARIRLFEEMPRVFGDSLCRALAILKNCRLLSPGEFFDLLSPLKLAANEGIIEGMSGDFLNKLMSEIDLSSKEDDFEMDERDRLDAERADMMNELFEDVVITESAEGKFL